ncbi:acyltransferase family protein [Ferruginibacter sp. SUN106]|uniref:acyltransferase family protein n=1 Tax=Ferruginibacter sp. SUN106 TaxID=2978348 RepID=UPI003D363531
MTATTQRFTALDVFRGMTICFMIIVNTPGNGATTFSPLLHAHWNGFTPTDLVFPSFLFAVGNAMSFVMPKWNNLQQSQVLWKILKRTFIIFLLGYLMYWFPFVKRDVAGNFIFAPFEDTRVFGVLQRIALCYGIASLIVYYVKPKTAVILAVIFLLAYWVLLYVFGDATDPLGMQTNAGSILDRWLLNEKHLYHGEGVAFDPEGLLSTLPAIANVIAGYIVGRYIQQKGNSYEGLTVLLLAGAALLFTAYCWNLNFPVNKKLWTSSFVVLTVGLDCIILATLIYIINFKNKTGWTWFFEVPGRNPLFIYLLSELGATLLYFFRADSKTTLYQWVYNSIFQPAGDYLGSFLFAVCFMLLCWLVGYFLDKRKIYIRV